MQGILKACTLSNCTSLSAEHGEALPVYVLRVKRRSKYSNPATSSLPLSFSVHVYGHNVEQEIDLKKNPTQLTS